MSPRRASIYNKRDANESMIIGALAAMGVDWDEGGPLDGWAWIGKWIPVEVKMPKGAFRQSQKDFIAKCLRTGRPYLVLRTPDDAITAVNALRR